MLKIIQLKEVLASAVSTFGKRKVLDLLFISLMLGGNQGAKL